MKNRRQLLMILGILLSLALATGSTLAYLTDTDSDVNVMTLGNVDIIQLENGLADNGFTNGQPLYPAYYEDEIDWDNSEGVVDKEVTVENLGASDAYVRTWFAFEAGDMTFDEFEQTILANLNDSSAWSWTWDRSATYTIKNETGEESEYFIAVAALAEALPAGETTDASLIDVAMSKEATNKIVNSLGKYYTILVKTQAMQTANFEEVSPADALAAGFGDEEVTDGAIGINHPWKDGYVQDYPVTADIWDGTVDTAWYNKADTEFMIMTAEQLAGFAQLVDEGNTFEGKTVKVGKDLDLNNYNFSPVGDVKEGKAFKGTFDGRNHVIGNVFYEETKHSGGNLYNSLFSYTDGATIKNLKMDDILIARYGGELASVAGLAKDTVFENITLTNSRIAGYNNSIGGIVSETQGHCIFKNVNVDASNTIGTFWGSYDTAVGGIVGYALSGSRIELEDCTVAGQIDAVNDACSNYMWFNYRNAGMLIGLVNGTKTIDGSTYAAPDASLTCTNVNVIYDDWANYHYCEFEKNGQGSYNAPDEFKFSRAEGTEYNGGFDVSTCEHTAVEDNHNVLLVFDQLYGGGKGVKGQPAHEGVTVVYNNK